MKKLLLLLFLLGTLGTSNLSAQIIDVDWSAGTPAGWPAPAASITVPAPWTVTGESSLDFINWGGSFGIRFITANTADDLWLAYHATGLTIGVDYKIEAELRTQNNKVDMTLYAWPESEGNSPASATVVGSPLPGFVDNADGDYSVTFEATSTSMVFGVGVKRDSGTPSCAVRNFKVTEVSGSLSTETDITGFTLAAQTGTATIDAGAHTVAIEVTNGTSLASLTPTITLSSGATVSPDTGVSQDFTSAVVYTVTAEDTIATENWTVTVTEAAASTETDITGFTLPEQAGGATIDAGAHTVDIEVTNGTSLASLTPTITLSSGATISPNSGVSQDFTSAVVYTVTAQDAIATEDWTVTVTEAAVSSDVFNFTLSNNQTEVDAFVAAMPGNGFINDAVSAINFGGSWGLRIEVDGSITFPATGLVAGYYEIVMSGRNQTNPTDYIQDVWVTGGTVPTVVTHAIPNGNFDDITNTVYIPTTGNYTFGIIRKSGTGMRLNSWRATYLGPTLSIDDAVLNSNMSVTKTGVSLDGVSGNVQIVDLLGRVLVSKNLEAHEKLNYNFKSASIYMVKLSTAKGNTTKKVVFK